MARWPLIQQTIFLNLAYSISHLPICLTLLKSTLNIEEHGSNILFGAGIELKASYMLDH